MKGEMKIRQKLESVRKQRKDFSEMEGEREKLVRLYIPILVKADIFWEGYLKALQWTLRGS